MNMIYFSREISSSQQNFFRMLDKKIDDVSVNIRIRCRSIFRKIQFYIPLSTLEFFKILKNIFPHVRMYLSMQGPDYDSSSETEMALEEARLNALVQHWESASLTASLCSSASRSLQGTPVRQTPMR